ANAAPAGAPRLRDNRPTTERSTMFTIHNDANATADDQLLLGGGNDSLEDLTPDQTADLIVGLRHRPLRDVALGYIEPKELPRAREPWALLARCCASATMIFVAALLTLAAFTAAVAGKAPAETVALERARAADPATFWPGS
ncbi:DUF4192 family protein, partial [Kitasatospora sp. NPDC058046]|uniref:DUF4192 family protein n=1 Tax=Kitasatospora sp. NPDC058046 TaxID=3346312 RepID=UPI0036D79B2B